MTEACVNVIPGTACVALALFRPWRRILWWLAGTRLGVAAFNADDATGWIVTPPVTGAPHWPKVGAARSLEKESMNGKHPH